MFTEVDNKIDVQHKEQDELKTQRVHSTSMFKYLYSIHITYFCYIVRPNDMSIYYKWLAFLKSSTSTTAYDFTNQSKIT